MAPRLSTQAGILAASRAAGQVANALVGIVVVRFLTKVDFGTFRQLYLLLGTLMVLTDLGFCESLYYFLPRQPERRAVFLRRALLFVGLMQVVVGVALVALRNFLGRFFNNADLPNYIGLLALVIGFTVITRLWEYQLIAQQRILGAAVISGGYEVFKVVLMFASLALVSTVEGLLWALVIGSGVKLLAFGWFLLREYRFFVDSPTDGGFGEQLRYALALGLPALFNVGAVQAHQYIVGYFSSVTDFAVYSTACFQVPFVGVLTTSIIEVLLVRITAARAGEQHDEVRDLWNLACTKSLFFFMPIAFALAALARPLINVMFTRNYSAAAPLFAILMAALPLSALFTDNVLRAYGAMRSYTTFYAFRLFLVLALGIVGVQFFGLWGAAASSVLALAIVKTWQLRKVAELLQVSYWRVLPWTRIARIIVASGLAAIPAFVCAQYLNSSLLALVLGLPLFGAGYIALSLWFGLVSWEETLRMLEDLFATLLAGVKSIRSEAD